MSDSAESTHQPEAATGPQGGTVAPPQGYGNDPITPRSTLYQDESDWPPADHDRLRDTQIAPTVLAAAGALTFGFIAPLIVFVWYRNDDAVVSNNAVNLLMVHLGFAATSFCLVAASLALQSQFLLYSNVLVGLASLSYVLYTTCLACKLQHIPSLGQILKSNHF